MRGAPLHHRLALFQPTAMASLFPNNPIQWQNLGGVLLLLFLSVGSASLITGTFCPRFLLCTYLITP